MPVVSTIIAAAALGTAAYGAYAQNQGQKAATAAQKDSIAAQQQAEALRQQQMNLDASRRKREIIRQGLAARAQAVATATGQGAGQGSGLAGGLAEISGRADENLTGVSQNLQIGNGIFAANQSRFAADSRRADAQGQAAFGAGLVSLGGAVLKNTDTISKVGTFAFNSLGFGTGGSSGSVGGGGSK